LGSHCVDAKKKAEKKGTSKHLWVDNELTTHMWQTINQQNHEELEGILATNPETANIRSSDGRGPLWWAYEIRDQAGVELLLAAGANPNEKDADGRTPSEVVPGATQYAQENQNINSDTFDPKSVGIPDFDPDEEVDI
jgi:hypothetical protein